MFSTKKNVLLFFLCLVVLLGGIVGGYKYKSISKYNNLIKSANKYMNSGHYSNAINLYTQSLKYKSDENVERTITLAYEFRKIEAIYNQGLKLLSSGKYLNAIETFEKVTANDIKLYSKSQKEIKESKNKYIALNMKLANNDYKNNKYSAANNCLENIFKIDTNNSDAKKCC